MQYLTRCMCYTPNIQLNRYVECHIKFSFQAWRENFASCIPQMVQDVLKMSKFSSNPLPPSQSTPRPLIGIPPFSATNAICNAPLSANFETFDLPTLTREGGRGRNYARQLQAFKKLLPSYTYMASFRAVSQLS